MLTSVTSLQKLVGVFKDRGPIKISLHDLVNNGFSCKMYTSMEGLSSHPLKDYQWRL